jgi:hypothetical protein
MRRSEAEPKDPLFSAHKNRKGQGSTESNKA